MAMRSRKNSRTNTAAISVHSNAPLSAPELTMLADELTAKVRILEPTFFSGEHVFESDNAH